LLEISTFCGSVGVNAALAVFAFTPANFDTPTNPSLGKLM
jgi:hypothetical protein